MMPIPIRQNVSSTLLVVAVAAMVFSGGCSEDINRGGIHPKVNPPEVMTGEARELAVRQVALQPNPGDETGRELRFANRIAASEIDFKDAFQPESEGWHSEQFAQEAEQQLKKLAIEFGKLPGFESRGAAHAISIDSIVRPDYRGTTLRPNSLHDQYRDDAIVIRRGAGTSKSNVELSLSKSGLKGFQDSLSDLAAQFSENDGVYVKFKIVGVSWDETLPQTAIHFHADGPNVDGMIQLNSHWLVTWMFDSGAPLIASVELTDYLEVASTDKITRFSDDTESILGTSPSFRNQLMYGIDYWRDRIPEYYGIYYFGHHGLAVGDVNGDRVDDVYVCQPGGLPNRLFLHQPDGTANDVSGKANVDVLNNTRSALIVDLDNDGDNDLVVCATDRLLVFDNQGNAEFTLAVQRTDVVGGYTVSAVDFDNDSLLDLYVCVYLNHTEGEGRLPFPAPYHDANNGGSNVLLQNAGGLRFNDVTEVVGLAQNNTRFSYAGVWEDFDLDDDMDLYVANDFGHNCLYRNDDGHFVDVAAEIGLEDTGFGMSATWGDFNSDGYMDLYVGNMYSSAGNRIAHQSKFQKYASPDSRRKLQRSARGNSLFANQGNGTFRDVGASCGAAMGRWSWGTLSVDANNNGSLDLIALNGMVTGTSSADL